VIQPLYDQVGQEALTPDSKVNSSKPDAVLLALDYRALPLKLSLADPETSSSTIHGAIAYLQMLRNGIRTNSNAVCIFQTFGPPAETLFGSLDRVLQGTLRNLLDNVNRLLAKSVFHAGDVLLDIAGLADTAGLGNWHDTKLWNMAKLPFSDELIPLYADHVARTVAALRGKSRKVLILDLDNTVWGGVIGDDGLEAIKVAQGDATGEAHLAVQRLKHRDFEQRSAEAFDQRSQSWLWHHWDEFVEHGSLTKQRLREFFGDVGFELTVISESLTRSSEQCQQDDGKSSQSRSRLSGVLTRIEAMPMPKRKSFVSRNAASMPQRFP
jgi:hypothetical protein